MTEVPEHLLARSRARREAAGLATPSEGGAAPAPSASEAGAVEPAAVAATPAPTTAPHPPPPPKPDPPYIQAYKNRKRIPYWAMPALTLLPLWAFIYANTLEKPPPAQTGPLAVGAKIFGNCASWWRVFRGSSIRFATSPACLRASPAMYDIAWITWQRW